MTLNEAERLARNIRRGENDEHLDLLFEAIAARKAQRREEVLTQVQAVYGPNATIQVSRR